MPSTSVYSGHVYSAYCFAKNVVVIFCFSCLERPCCVRQLDVQVMWLHGGAGGRWKCLAKKRWLQFLTTLLKFLLPSNIFGFSLDVLIIYKAFQNRFKQKNKRYDFFFLKCGDWDVWASSLEGLDGQLKGLLCQLVPHLQKRERTNYPSFDATSRPQHAVIILIAQSSSVRLFASLNSTQEREKNNLHWLQHVLKKANYSP